MEETPELRNATKYPHKPIMKIKSIFNNIILIALRIRYIARVNVQIWVLAFVTRLRMMSNDVATDLTFGYARNYLLSHMSLY